jgi:hypothetical protein
MFLRRFKKDPYAEARKRLIRETEAALLYGFTLPKRIPRIPTAQVGCGAFQPKFAAAWWCATLDLDPATYRELDRGPAHTAILPEFRTN